MLYDLVQAKKNLGGRWKEEAEDCLASIRRHRCENLFLILFVFLSKPRGKAIFMCGKSLFCVSQNKAGVFLKICMGWRHKKNFLSEIKIVFGWVAK